MTGSVEIHTSLRGRKHVFSNDDIAHIDNLIQQQPDITINEIMDTLHLKVSDETVRKDILKLGYVYKKKSLPASEQERPRHPAETGKLAAAYSGERHKTTTILPSIRLDGPVFTPRTRETPQPNDLKTIWNRNYCPFARSHQESFFYHSHIGLYWVVSCA